MLHVKLLTAQAWTKQPNLSQVATNVELFFSSQKFFIEYPFGGNTARPPFGTLLVGQRQADEVELEVEIGPGRDEVSQVWVHKLVFLQFHKTKYSRFLGKIRKNIFSGIPQTSLLGHTKKSTCFRCSGRVTFF